MKKKILIGVLIFAGLLWLNNTSLFIDASANLTSVLAHRGVQQTYSRENLENDTCTAQRIYQSEHAYLENTIPSMRAAFAAGAEVVELDIHLTTDKQFAVFHDWTVDCRTEGNGVTQELDMVYLKELDIGYGYTSDEGKTYPLRGMGVGMMPTLRDVFEAIPDGRFLVNFKSRRAEEGEALGEMLNSNPEWRKQVFGVYGGETPTRIVQYLVADMPGYDKSSTFSCLGQYVAMGWSGFVPGVCRNTFVAVPSNVAPFLWGWPHKFTQRMADAGSRVILLGPFDGGGGSAGIDSEKQLGMVPENFDGLVWTNRVETLGGLISQKD